MPNIDGLQFRTNINNDWSTYNINTVIILTDVDDYVQFQNTNNNLSFVTVSNNTYNYVHFSMEGKIAASGNIQSMLNYSTSCLPYCYYSMFTKCTSLTTAPELPAPTLADHCYYNMFNLCGNLRYIKVGFTNWNNRKWN